MVEIVEPKSSWAAEFRELAERLESLLGRAARRIDHIGSTSVPGLPAKDVIDVQIRIGDWDPEIGRRMEQGGFRRHRRIDRDHVPPGEPESLDEWRKELYVEREGDRRANLHVRREGASNAIYPLLFRDYLRARPQTAAAYAQLKRLLSTELREGARYATVKDPAVDLIWFAAREWAERTGWVPDRESPPEV
ncbi:MAG TPA: hypothetical protein DCQ98_00015 [Planctomycetaceae bacterium]|nr:hypothetical protein [Planctomycetaceae bacterium]HRF01786.1 GrpB family protein [Pirellulaceae bacterium]